MCGICFRVSCAQCPTPLQTKWEVQAVRSRGPSSYSAHICTWEGATSSTATPQSPLPTTCSDYYGGADDTVSALSTSLQESRGGGEEALVRRKVCMSGAVLHLQGSTSTVNRQPFPPPSPLSPSSFLGVDSSRSLLLWNGEVFGGKEVIPEGCSDTSVIYNRFNAIEAKVLQGHKHHHDDDEGGSRVVMWAEFMAEVGVYLESGAIIGPYAFVYLPASINVALRHNEGACIFGRDPLGRRSLIVSHMDDGDVMISSVGSTSAAAAVSAREALAAALPPPLDAACDTPTGQQPTVAVFPFGVTEVPTTGVHGAQPRVSADGVKSVLFTSRPWRLDNRTHPLLGCAEGDGRPTWRSLAGAPLATNSTTRGVVDWVLAEVGYVHNLDVDCPREHALTYLYALAEAVRRRVDLTTRTLDGSNGEGGAPVMVLFSGGIDCTVLAALAHYLLPVTTPLELSNVAFGGGSKEDPTATSSASSTLTSKGESAFHDAPDRLTGYLSFAELAILPTVPAHIQLGLPSSTLGDKRQREDPTRRRDWRLVEVDVTPQLLTLHHGHIMSLVSPRSTVMDHNIGSALWFGARGVGRMVGAEAVLEAMGAMGDGCGGTAVRHGGDGAVLAATTTVVDPFQSLVDVLVEEGAEEEGGVVVPKMVLLATLGKEYGERLAPAWRGGYKKMGFFIDAAAQAGRVRIGKVGGHATGKGVRLVDPRDILLARGVTEKRERHLKAMGGGVPYECVGRIVLMGMGADETLGGYVRHQRAVSRYGLQGLHQELQRDFERLWERNLGRDDRVVGDSGREGRFPFIDEGVLAVLASPDILPLSSVCEFELPSPQPPSCGASPSPTLSSVPPSKAVGPGVGDKKVIRTVARMLGIRDGSRLQKRAIQFGTRIADRKMQGSAKLSELE